MKLTEIARVIFGLEGTIEISAPALGPAGLLSAVEPHLGHKLWNNKVTLSLSLSLALSVSLSLSLSLSDALGA